MKYRKKAVVIDAERFTVPDDAESGDTFTAFGQTWPLEQAQTGWCIAISTLEGVMRAKPGDWIIRGVEGEYYPCKSDIFKATYEPV